MFRSFLISIYTYENINKLIKLNLNKFYFILKNKLIYNFESIIVENVKILQKKLNIRRVFKKINGIIN